MNTFDYFAFISYSHKDQALAKRLKKRLHSYHLPSRLQKSYPSLPKNLKPIFLDESNLVGIGGSLQKALQQNLDNSNYLIVICSPNSAKSEYVNDEVKHFIEIGRKDHIVPLIVEGVPYSESEECFPPALRELPREEQLLGVDMTKFGERDAFLRVIATMLELNLDKFVADEERERKRMAVRFGAIAAALVLTVGMLFRYETKKRYDGEIQYSRGNMYRDGWGVEQDYIKALNWYRKAAANGNSSAQNQIGDMYRYGQGVEQDYLQAMEWYTKAAANGNALAQFNIGYMYDHGLGVEKDYLKAVEWYKRAAANGNAVAQANVGYLYLHGSGVTQDYAKAIEWYEKAAAQGITEAQEWLDKLKR